MNDECRDSELPTPISHSPLASR